MRKGYYFIVLILVLSSCADNVKQLSENSWSAELTELLGEDYPNNPDMSICHSAYVNIAYKNVAIEKSEEKGYDIVINPIDEKDTVVIRNLNLLEFMPTICEKVEGNAYLEKIAIINQEWNRQQVKFLAGEFEVSGENTQKIERVDIARNCLNSYLWEVIFYVSEEGVSKPYYHGWFDFPHDLYTTLFKEKNGKEFSNYATSLEDWIDPEHQQVKLEELRTFNHEIVAAFENRNDEAYPLKGERKKKFMNIMYPKNTNVIQDFLTDSTIFATFSPPGFYNQQEPRTTELSRLANLDSTYFRTLETKNLFELELVFNANNEDKKTQLIVSGINQNEIPTLAVEEVNAGWQNSMGFGNHTFYEGYKNALTHPSKTSEYFAILTDVEDRWIDSHFVGIDGPMLHWDVENPDLLHFWILSFERHAFVGHYVIDTGLNS